MNLEVRPSQHTGFAAQRGGSPSGTALGPVDWGEGAQ